VQEMQEMQEQFSADNRREIQFSTGLVKLKNQRLFTRYEDRVTF
jgi:hypothetical protein